MKGYVLTPGSIVDRMVERLFRDRPPIPSDRILDPGSGEGEFEAGIVRWCEARSLPTPNVLGVELDPKRIAKAKVRFLADQSIRYWNRNFLLSTPGRFDYVIGNPPYVPITGLNQNEKELYRPLFRSAVERFDLYTLFFEKSLTLLDKGGRLCLITPEKFEYVHSAAPLRRFLDDFTVDEIDHLDESSFPGLVTYPTITLVRHGAPAPSLRTLVRLRDGKELRVQLPRGGAPWSPSFHPIDGTPRLGPVLIDVCERVSCGIATGADSLFVHRWVDLPASLNNFAYPTVSGRQLGLSSSMPIPNSSAMLVPYARDGRLLAENELGDLLTFLSRPDNQRHLKDRTCVTGKSQVWYKFHDNAPLSEILRPKILCKDITAGPRFWADREGIVVPRHTVYYIVPREGVPFDSLLEYLNGEDASAWLRAHCQRAANGFYRLQSAALKRLPIPDFLAKGVVPVKKRNASRVGKSRRHGRGRQTILAA